MNDHEVDLEGLDAIKRMIEDDLVATRRLNDNLRVNRCGGMVNITAGIAGLGPSTVNQVFTALASFDGFDRGNDPNGEHDCAVVTVAGIKVIWKIAYYDRRRLYRSPNPADPDVTVRVLTVMRADEY